MSKIQSNIQPGDRFTGVAGGTLTNGLLAKIHTDGTYKPVAAANDTRLVLVLEDASSGDNVALQRLHPGTEVRAICGTVSGTQNAGVALYATSDGHVSEVSTSATKVGYALETFVTGQYVKFQPIAQT
jgi:hypothetical protein